VPLTKYPKMRYSNRPSKQYANYLMHAGKEILLYAIYIRLSVS
jgi:hypothetical protein